MMRILRRALVAALIAALALSLAAAGFAEAVEEAAPVAGAETVTETELGPLLEIPQEIPADESESAVEPTPEGESESVIMPLPGMESEPVAEPAPEAEPEAVEETEAEPAPEPAEAPVAESESEPDEAPVEEPAPEPAEAPVAESESEPVAEPMPEAEPEDAEEPEAEPEPYAAEDDMRSIVYDETTAPYDGVWVTFDDGFQLLLPGEWLSYEITEEQSAAGLFFRAGNDGSDSVVGEVPMGVAVSFVEAGGLTTLDDLVGDFESVGFTNLEKLDLNGIPVVFFIKPDEDYCGVAFYHAIYPEYVMAIYATPIGDAGDAVAAVNDAILSSLKPYIPQE